MKKLLLSFAFVFALVGCKKEFDEEKIIMPLTYEQELAIINNYTTIDTINYRYSAIITDEIMFKHNLTEKNVIRALKSIESINKSIEDDVKDGKVVSLILNNIHGFKSFAVNIDRSQIKFLDVYVPEAKLERTGRVYNGQMTFAYGNWFEYSKSFDAKEQVTTDFSVMSCDGYWSTAIVCETGSSSYGPAFTIYGNSNTAGCIKRYWWFTESKNTSCHWTFRAQKPVGGNAKGYFYISDTY